jgi:hypothetical protein
MAHFAPVPASQVTIAACTRILQTKQFLKSRLSWYAANQFHCMFHSLEGVEWISNKGLWRMPMSQYAPLMKALPAVPGVRLDVEPLPTVAQALVQV